MNKKKLLPLAVLACIVALLGVLLAVLNRTDSAQTDTTIPLCSLAADDLDTLAYAGNNMEVTLLKGSDGTWRLDSDPTLPLDQTKVQSLVEGYTGLTALRKLEGDDLAALPEKSQTPQITIMLGAGEQSVNLTVDQLNSMYDMLTSMKSDEIQDKLYADGAALEHNLDSSAINTYSASKIKKTVSK